MNNQNTYLLLWNPSRYNWHDFTEDWKDYHAGWLDEFGWSSGNRKQMELNDRIFLMCLGYKQPVQGIFISGYVTRKPYQDETWDEQAKKNTATYVYFKPDAWLHPDYEFLLDPRQLIPEFNWTPQISGVKIPALIAENLENIWAKHLESSGIVAQRNSIAKNVENQNAQETFIEGAKRRTISYRYERNQEAREKCIEIYGYKCSVCDLDMFDLYGDIAETYIVVHHLKPIAEQGKEYELDPVNDLRPVCPNCHAMLHQKTPPYSIEEMRRRIRFKWSEIWGRLS